ncbi:MAG: LPS export ABC transporter periplasmic protein LptC [Candidatus Marinimicrobia bacterium]|jgi:LPS export ABC transporter protein LptC|nr:LPS export ABC transporter periplasmic protein LptC [Candidatus Neomarinimicrobiota bacterium]MDP6592734.1 LPS export ABC transporter periplasmic protein LptC [Candidatus Neomarinimicrobiota bacterium]MDP6835796.1 LPS export ABC transporter periplasmic protein LptC [Candidatus Neomarinimicrobiota bacterium]MDP6966444.1 LPS export ABC transporter periplasmic protein LptC [Candidatus Neomarinimicrobiota bacterium]|tara:strand:+ start:556 stop:1074 length:519 start_codon:yes stop_codon:yes gene_type:complete
MIRCGWIAVALLISCSVKEDASPILTKDDFPDQESWNPTIILTREGRKRAVVRSGHLAKYSEVQEVVLDKKVDADFFSAEEEHMSNLKSEKALVYEATDNLLAIENVIVLSDSGVALFTDSLFWDNKAEKISTNDSVMLTTEIDDTLYGVGFESNVDLTHWKILKPWGVTSR